MIEVPLYSWHPRFTPAIGPRLDRAGPGKPGTTSVRDTISHKVFFTSFCRSQLSHKSINVSVTITITTNKLKDLCGN